MIFKWIYHHTFLYRVIDFFKSAHTYHKDKRLISDTLYSKEFNFVLKKYLKIDFKKDWIGRLYGVINPNLNEDGQYDFNSVVIEIDGDNTNNNEYVKNWVYRQMNLVGQLFKIEKLYDYINIDFKHVGPENMDNYLVVFDIVSRQIYAESAKNLFKHILFLGILFVGAFFGLKYFAIL